MAIIFSCRRVVIARVRVGHPGTCEWLLVGWEIKHNENNTCNKYLFL